MVLHSQSLLALNMFRITQQHGIICVAEGKIGREEGVKTAQWISLKRIQATSVYIMK